jgi:hypothetical protein
MNEVLTRAATFEPSTYNPDKRTVQVTFSTGAEVQRSDWEGPFIERLSMDAGAVNLSELIGGPVLDNHDRFSGVRSILGVVDAAAIEGNRGVATLRFSERHDAIAKDVQAGIISKVSAGYTVQRWDVSKRSDGMRIKTATSWTPKEISFTAIGADAGAKTRSIDTTMELHEQIRTMTTLLGLPPTFAEGLIERNDITIEQARSEALAELTKRTPTIQNRAPATITRDSNEDVVVRMADGLRSRINPGHKPEAGREFAYSTVADIARRCLELRGGSTIGSPADIITRAMHTTSDFANVLAEVYNKELLQLRSAPSPIVQVFKRATVSDFRNRHVMEISDGPALQKINETGEITFSTITDKSLASYAVDSYARGFSLSFKSLVNDDMGALSDLSGKMSRGARAWFSSFLIDTLVANPKLADNSAVFLAGRANLAASGAAPSDTTVGAGKAAIRLQKDASGNPLNIAPKYIVAPVALEGTIDKLLATLYPQQPDDAITELRNLTPIIDARLDAKDAYAWYLFCDPSEAPVFEYCELSGYEGPQVETQQGFKTLGVEIRVVWHVGAGAIDGRGAWKNPGR